MSQNKPRLPHLQNNHPHSRKKNQNNTNSRNQNNHGSKHNPQNNKVQIWDDKKKPISNLGDDDALNASDSGGEPCLLCTRPMGPNHLSKSNPPWRFSVGVCDHRDVCWRCALKYRNLYDEKGCCICKQQTDLIIFTLDSQTPYSQIDQSKLFKNEKLGFLTDSKDHLQEVGTYWEVRCRVCSDTFAKIEELTKHLASAHQKTYCKICLEEKKIFLNERELLDQKDLQSHMQSSHERCNFCKRWFFSNDLLYRHLEMDHFKCYLCQKYRDISYQYYDTYDTLEEHFSSEHFLCPEEICKEKKWVVFYTELDLTLHLAATHSVKGKSKGIKINFDQKDLSLPTGPRGAASSAPSDSRRARDAPINLQRNNNLEEELRREQAERKREEERKRKQEEERQRKREQKRKQEERRREEKRQQKLQEEASIPPNDSQNSRKDPRENNNNLSKKQDNASQNSKKDNPRENNNNPSKKQDNAPQNSKKDNPRENNNNSSKKQDNPKPSETKKEEKIIPLSKEQLLEKNKEMVAKMKAVLGEEKFLEFRKFSSDFKNDKITVEYFYVRYQNLFGERADELFSILVELLPDPAKREALERVYRKAQDVFRPKQNQAMENDLTKNYNDRTCPYCSKKISSRMWKDHVDKHKLEEKKPTGIEDFPALLGDTPNETFTPFSPFWRNPSSLEPRDPEQDFPSLPSNPTPKASAKQSQPQPLNYSQLSSLPSSSTGGKKKKPQKVTLLRFG